MDPAHPPEPPVNLPNRVDSARDTFVGSTLNQQQERGVRFGDAARLAGLVAGENLTVQGAVNIYLTVTEPAASRAPAGPRPAAPYPGMVPFQLRQAALFFGRDTEIDDITSRLERQGFLLVLGASGSGKSSLILAGVLPALARSPAWDPGFWQVVTLQPGAAPATRLAAALGADPANPDAAIAASLARAPGAGRLLLVVDQFEEAFTQAAPHPGATADRLAARDEQRAFLETLQTWRDRPACALILTLRADFLGELLDQAPWAARLAERVEIAPLRDDALRAAIRRPAEEAGVTVEDGLVERLLADAADQPGSLPLLQETLRRLWERMRNRTLTLDSYLATGRDGQSGLAVAVADKADRLYRGLPPEQQALARRIFLRLVQFGEGRADTRRRQPLLGLRAADDDPAAFDDLLGRLVAARLLTLTGDPGGGLPQVDLAHEALLLAWPTLRTWLDAGRQAEQARRQLEAKTAEWVRHGRGAGALLDEAELAEAESQVQLVAKADLGVGADVAAFLDASRAAVQARGQERDRLVAQERQLAQMQGQARIDRAWRLATVARNQLESDQLLSLRLITEAVVSLRSAGQDPDRYIAETLHTIVQAQHLDRTVSPGINSLAYSPDGRHILTADAYAVVSVWDAATGAAVATWPIAQQAIWSVAYRPDGQEVAVAGTGGLVRLLRLADGAETHTLVHDPEGRDVRAAVYSPDGAQLATAGGDGTLKLWETSRGRLLATCAGHQAAIGGVAYSPDGARLATAGADAVVKLWDRQSGQELRTLQGHKGPGCSVAFSPDGQSIITSGTDATVFVWDATTGELGRTIPMRIPPPPRSASDELFMGSVIAGRDIHVTTTNYYYNPNYYNANAPDLRRPQHPSSAWLWRAVYSPDGRQILAVNPDKDEVTLWDANTGQFQGALASTGTVTGAVYRPDGGDIVTTTMGGATTVWDRRTMQRIGQIGPHAGALSSAAYSPDGRCFLTTGSDGTAKIWDTATEQLIQTIPGVGGAGAAGWYGPGKQELMFVNGEHMVIIWDLVSDQERLRVGAAAGGSIVGAAGCPDGQCIVTAAADGTAGVWDAGTGALIRPLRLPGERDPGKGTSRTSTGTGVTPCVAYSPDGHAIAAVDAQNVVTIWDAESGTPLRTVSGHRSAVTSVSWSANDGRIVTTSAAGTARVWDSATGTLLHMLRGHAGPVRGAAFAPAGRHLATAGDDERVCLWDATTGAEVLALTVGAPATGVVYSPDGTRLLVTAATGGVRQYVVDVDALLAHLVEAFPTRLTDAELAAYLAGPALPRPPIPPDSAA